MVHKDICIPFEVSGHKYEAVGFLEKGEFNGVTGREALARVGGAIGGEDFRILAMERELLPKGYRLMTAARGKDGCVKGFFFGRSKPNFQWDGQHFVDEPLHWMINDDYNTEGRWDDRYLIIIRRVE